MTEERKPTMLDFIEWSKQWAYELWLCGFSGSTRWDDPRWDRFSSQLYGPLTYSDARPSEFQEDPNSRKTRILNEWANELAKDIERIRIVQLHPELRKEANGVADAMLKDKGVSQEVIAAFKQVLPYKMAHYLRVQNYKPDDMMVLLWILREDGDVIRPVVVNITQDLSKAAEEIRRAFPLISDQAWKENDEPWKYSFIIGFRTSKNPGCDGVLNTTSDYRKMILEIRSASTPTTSAVLYHRSLPEDTPLTRLHIATAGNIAPGLGQGSPQMSLDGNTLDTPLSHRRIEETGSRVIDLDQDTPPLDLNEGSILASLRGNSKPASKPVRSMSLDKDKLNPTVDSEDSLDPPRSKSLDDLSPTPTVSNSGKNPSSSEERQIEALGSPNSADGNDEQTPSSSAEEKTEVPVLPHTPWKGSIANYVYPAQITVWLHGKDFHDEPFEFPEIPAPSDNQGDRTLWTSRLPGVLQ